MGKYVKVFLGIMVMFLTVLSGIQAADAAEYTYTLTFSAGDQGDFVSADTVKVNNRKTKSDYKIAMAGKKIQVTGLKAGDIVSCDGPSAVTLGDNSKYYVKGIRLSGRDNNTVAKSAFIVDSDQDYVVAYGIPGELTEYTVNYLDESGNALAESQTYYGNVGDEPVIAYLYIDGYIPATYNQTRALVADKTKNVFDFVYRVGTEEELAQQEEDSDTGTCEAADEGTTPGDNGTPADSDQNAGGGNGAESSDAVNPGGTGNADAGSTNDGTDNLGVNENADELTQIADGNVPLGQRAANAVRAAASNGALAPIIVGFISVLALIVLVVFAITAHRKRMDY